MLEFILVAHEGWVDESIYGEIIKKHEEYACPADAPGGGLYTLRQPICSFFWMMAVFDSG